MTLTKEQKENLDLGLLGGGTYLTGKKIYDYQTHKMKLNPASKNIAIVYPGGSSGHGHKVPGQEIIRDLVQRGYNVDLFDTDEYQNKLVKNVISKRYLQTVAKDPISAMPTETKWDPDVQLGKQEPLDTRLKERKFIGKEKKSKLSQLLFEIWNKGAGHDKLVKDIKARRSGGYQRVISMFGPTADILKPTGLPVDVVQTDWGQNPLIWETDTAGMYHVPNEFSKKRFMDIGVPEDKINVTNSLVVSDKFRNLQNIKPAPEIIEHRKNFPSSKVVTVSGGAAGVQVHEIAEQTAKYYLQKDPNAKIVAITANNKKGYKHLEQKIKSGELPNIILKGYEPNISSYTTHSDYNIIRPGGSTTTEAIYTGKPIITYQQAPVADSWSHVGAHESANVKMVNDLGISKHFHTKYDLNNYKNVIPGMNFISDKSGSKITNIHELSDVIEDLEKNFESISKKAIEVKDSFLKTNPVESILAHAPLKNNVPKMNTVNKAILGTGIAAAILGGGHLLKRKYFDKQAELSTTEKIGIGAGTTALGTGILANAISPALGNHRKFIGPAIALKKLFFDLPLHGVSKGKYGKSLTEAIGLGKSSDITMVKLTPTVIRQKSIAKAMSENPELAKNTNLEILNASLKHDRHSTIELLKEQEAQAKLEGKKKLIGISHFTPQEAAMLGFKESPALSDFGNKVILEKNPTLYYNTERKNSIKKLKDSGISSLDDMDAYWLSANKKGLRVFEKDLDVAPEKSKEVAKELFSKMPKDRVEKLVHLEKQFKKRYDSLLRDIAIEKDTITY